MSAAAIAEKLGGRKVLHRAVDSELDLAEAIRDGLPAQALEYVLADLRPWVATQADVLRVVGSERTLHRKRGSRSTLSATESDRLARLARILVRTEQALGDAEKARRWLTRCHPLRVQRCVRRCGRHLPCMRCRSDRP